ARVRADPRGDRAAAHGRGGAGAALREGLRARPPQAARHGGAAGDDLGGGLRGGAPRGDARRARPAAPRHAPHRVHGGEGGDDPRRAEGPGARRVRPPRSWLPRADARGDDVPGGARAHPPPRARAPPDAALRRALDLPPGRRRARGRAVPRRRQREPGRARVNPQQIVEAVLFASDAPLTADEIARADESLDEDVVEEVIQLLRAEYDDARRAFQLVELAEGYQVLTRPEFAPYL